MVLRQSQACGNSTSDAEDNQSKAEKYSWPAGAAGALKMPAIREPGGFGWEDGRRGHFVGSLGYFPNRAAESLCDGLRGGCFGAMLKSFRRLAVWGIRRVTTSAPRKPFLFINFFGLFVGESEQNFKGLLE